MSDVGFDLYGVVFLLSHELVKLPYKKRLIYLYDVSPVKSS